MTFVVIISSTSRLGSAHGNFDVREPLRNLQAGNPHRSPVTARGKQRPKVVDGKKVGVVRLEDDGRQARIAEAAEKISHNWMEWVRIDEAWNPGPVRMFVDVVQSPPTPPPTYTVSMILPTKDGR